jgi:hypothetical protein
MYVDFTYRPYPLRTLTTQVHLNAHTIVSASGSGADRPLIWHGICRRQQPMWGCQRPWEPAATVGIQNLTDRRGGHVWVMRTPGTGQHWGRIQHSRQHPTQLHSGMDAVNMARCRAGNDTDMFQTTACGFVGFKSAYCCVCNLLLQLALSSKDGTTHTDIQVAMLVSCCLAVTFEQSNRKQLTVNEEAASCADI